MAQGEVNLGGPVKVISEGDYPEKFAIYQRPAESRAVFEEKGWSTVAALQLRNPMHNSHAYLAWSRSRSVTESTSTSWSAP
jgi:sulfate adenylyltransferase